MSNLNINSQEEWSIILWTCKREAIYCVAQIVEGAEESIGVDWKSLIPYGELGKDNYHYQQVTIYDTRSEIIPKLKQYIMKAK